MFYTQDQAGQNKVDHGLCDLLMTSADIMLPMAVPKL